MAIPEPSGALWTAVKAITDPWPPDDEDTARALGERWRRSGQAASQAGSSAATAGSGVTGAWPDAAAVTAAGRTAEAAQRLGTLAQQTGQAAAGAENYATVLTATKTDITSTISANEASYQTLSNPAFGAAGAAARQAFAGQVAGLLGNMVKARAAALPRDPIAIAPDGPPDPPAPPGPQPPPPPPPAGATPEQNKAWWASLTKDQQDAIIRDHPELIGRRNGIPVVARDQANRTLFQRQFSQLQQERADVQRRIDDADANTPITALLELDARRKELDQQLGKMNGLNNVLNDRSKPYFLIDLDTSGNGKAALSLGNPDTAKNVATFVPGIRTDLGSSETLARQINAVSAATAARSGNTDNAVIAWYDYDAPDGIIEGMSPDAAAAAAPALTDFQHSLRVTHTGAASHNTILGYSYGSAVTGRAAMNGPLDADDVVFIGSPGVGADNVSQLHLPPGHVFATESDGDQLARAANTEIVPPGAVNPATGEPTSPPVDPVLNIDPTKPEFGARVFGSDPGIGHEDYWDPARAPITLGRIGRIVANQPPD